MAAKIMKIMAIWREEKRGDNGVKSNNGEEERNVA
jgi:hypothetical protein